MARKRRKHPLLKNEIEMIQKTLSNEVYPAEFYIKHLIKQLQELKQEWYKSK